MPKGKARLLLLLSLLCLSSCGEGRNLFISDALEVVSGIRNCFLSGEYLSSPSLYLTEVTPEGTTRYVYDGGTRVYYMDAPEGYHRLQIVGGALYEYGSVLNEEGERERRAYLLEEETPTAMFRMIARNYMQPALSAFRKTLDSALYFLNQISAYEDSSSSASSPYTYRVLSEGNEDFDMVLSGNGVSYRATVKDNALAYFSYRDGSYSSSYTLTTALPSLSFDPSSYEVMELTQTTLATASLELGGYQTTLSDFSGRNRFMSGYDLTDIYLDEEDMEGYARYESLGIDTNLHADIHTYHQNEDGNLVATTLSNVDMDVYTLPLKRNRAYYGSGYESFLLATKEHTDGLSLFYEEVNKNIGLYEFGKALLGEDTLILIGEDGYCRYDHGRLYTATYEDTEGTFSYIHMPA